MSGAIGSYREDSPSNDEKLEELQSIQTIYPNTTIIDYEKLTGSIDISIEIDDGIDVVLGEDSNSVSGGGTPRNEASSASIKRSSVVHHLPPIRVHFVLPDKYPHMEPPEVTLDSSVLSEDKLSSLEEEIRESWSELRGPVLFDIIDKVQQKAQYHLQELIGTYIDCSQHPEMYQRIVDYEKSTQLELFCQKIFFCNICQTDKKGTQSSQFPRCKHVYCNDCLKTYYTACIEEGSVDELGCPDFQCKKNYIEWRERSFELINRHLENFDFQSYKQRMIKLPLSINTLSEILSYHESDMAHITNLVKRYHDLFVKQRIQRMAKLLPTRLVLCPRKSCAEQIYRSDLEDSLVICPKCRLAFCNWCRKSWHGKYVQCSGIAFDGEYSGIPIEDLEIFLNSDEDSEARKRLYFLHGKNMIRRVADEYNMDKLFKQVIDEAGSSLKACPTCGVVTQRMDGCNKMKCSICGTSFCNLCGCYLEKNKPYAHFTSKKSSCYGRLFEGMQGIEENDLQLII